MTEETEMGFWIQLSVDILLLFFPVKVFPPKSGEWKLKKSAEKRK